MKTKRSQACVAERPEATGRWSLSSLRGVQFVVLGLGRSGRCISRFLLRARARVAAWDDSPAARASDEVAALAAQGLELVRRLDSVNADWAVVSPGIPDAHPTVVTLRRRGVRVVDELDFAARFVPGPLVAVTGTNGKSTTTTLIARILAASGRRVFSGGNLAPGRPLSCGLGRTQYDSYVVEVSSFQLARAQWLRPKVAVLLNITPDHLNRHRTMAAYAESKLRILDRQTRDDFVVLNRDDGRVWQARARGRGMKRAFSVRHRTGAAYLADGILWCLGHKVIPRDLLALPGEHNVANALAACLAAGLLGASPDAMRRVLESFHGLPHRLERVAVKGGVVFINNSMSTNPAAAVSSLAAVAQARPVVLIAGGREKGLPVDDHLAAIERQAKWVVLTGENRQHLARSLQQRGFTRWSTSANLRAAVRVARRKARPGDAVLFSPGFASFDQFRDFQERGEEFRSAVLDNTGAEDSRKPARRRRS